MFSSLSDNDFSVLYLIKCSKLTILMDLTHEVAIF